MNKKLTPTKIEYGDWNWNFYPGCLHKPQGICPVPSCWAETVWNRRMAAAAKKGITLPDFHTPHLIPELLLAPLYRKKPSIILVNFTGDLFGDWVNPEMHIGIDVVNKKLRMALTSEMHLGDVVLRTVEDCPQHTFLFLTKNPAGLRPWSPFPDNALPGVTAWNAESMAKACMDLAKVEAKHKWLSIEPLLGMIVGSQMDRMLWKMAGIGWVVIGAQTQPQVNPRIEWVKEIIQAANAAGIPVWLKDNLYKLLMECPAEDHDLYWEDMSHLRQEVPW